MLVAVGAFACLDTYLKLLAQHYPTSQVMTLRALASLPFLFLPALLTGQAHLLKANLWGWHFGRGLLQIFVLATFIYGLRRLSLADAYAIFLSAPLMVTALSVPMLKEHVGWRRWTAICVGMCGVLVILRPSGPSLASVGALVMLVSAAGYAINVITVRFLTKSETTASITAWPLVVTAVLTGLYSAPNWVAVQPAHWMWIVGAGIFGAVGQRMLTEAFRAAPPAVVAPFEYMALVYGVIIDALLWSLFPSRHVLLGGALVIGSGLYLIWRERRLHLAHIKTAPEPT